MSKLTWRTAALSNGFRILIKALLSHTKVLLSLRQKIRQYFIKIMKMRENPQNNAKYRVLLFIVQGVAIYGTGCCYLWCSVLLFMVHGVFIYGTGFYYLWYRVLIFMV